MADKKIDVKTSVGTWGVVKPKAGVRNRALEKAETDTGFKRMILLTEMLPKCISSRPDSFDMDVPIEQVLNGLEIEDYDLLIEGLGILLEQKSNLEEVKN